MAVVTVAVVAVSLVNTTLPRSTSRILVSDDGWSEQRRHQKRGAVLSKASGSSGQMKMNEGESDVFIDLKTTTIDSSDGTKLRAHVDAVLGKKYHSRSVTVYAIKTPDETLVKSLYQGKVCVKTYQQRKAICHECKQCQG